MCPINCNSKQTAAGSVRLPGIRLGEGEEKGSREERRKNGIEGRRRSETHREELQK